MKIKIALLIGAISTTSIIATSANAVDFNTTFTGDDTVLSFSYAVNGGTVNNYDLSALSGLNYWPTSTSLSLSGLASNNSYDFIWEIQNSGGPSGFLADFTLDSIQYLSSTDSNIWSVSSDGITWSNVTSYGTNAITDPNIWYSISTIDTNAEWIWDDSNATAGENLFIKASITSPVPEPSIYALMLGGLGLVGFMAAHRRKAS